MKKILSLAKTLELPVEYTNLLEERKSGDLTGFIHKIVREGRAVVSDFKRAFLRVFL